MNLYEECRARRVHRQMEQRRIKKEKTREYFVKTLSCRNVLCDKCYFEFTRKYFL